MSRLALIGMIGGGTAACSSDASRLSDPFTNPFSSSEPAATGSLGEGGESMTSAPAIRTSRIQSQELAAPGSRMTARPLPTPRVAAAEPVMSAGGAVDGMNPSAGKAMTPRVSPAAPQPKMVFGKGPQAEKLDKAAEARREAEARKEAEAKKQADARKAAEAKKAAESKSAPKHSAKAETKPDPKADKKVDAKREAEAKAAKAEASKKVAEAKAAEAAAKASAKETKQAAAKPAVKEAPVVAEKPAATKVASAEPTTTASVKADTNESFRWPAKGRVINGYGTSGNEGINIAVPEGTPVKAAEDGTVAYAGSEVKGYGKLVLVRHSNGYVSAYAHNGELDVKPGDKVKRGQTIAKSGATGNVTSPQLHFEIRKGATPVDPMPHLASN
ncbi:murein DD-endopeptidase MepM/ murein hydrolase activator NlpD [Methylobacterium brachythecii]|uniref:Murein DD-endopeptidase MepM/ murein hydrolase activator NlpD n=1 Tax=Methylobacterium brachythecii TaxID=1176177 RepID=A0A7W6AHI4_9HYPH|nr:murein DD-endopeptidase MepM/ murein hydrolase activator NlpD [Methylobacterium brachythecii]